MDILTPKGQETAEQERDAIALFCSAYPRLRFVHTPKDQPAFVDGFIVQDGTIVAVVETKCRQMTKAEFKKFENKWLVTWEKLDCAHTIAEMLCVPVVGFLYLVPDKTLLFARLWDYKEKRWVPKIVIQETKTQATVNGGTANRMNAYIDMTDATEIRPPQKSEET